MPFKSAKQRAYMAWKLPDIYKRWVAKYGKKVQPGKKKAK